MLGLGIIRNMLWEDTWFGNSPLSVQFWLIYVVCNEQNISLANAWDGINLKLTFRRNFSTTLMEQWFQLLEIVKFIVFSADADALVWQLENKGVYSTSFLYHVVNFT